LCRRCGDGGGDYGVDNGGECGGKVRTAAKAEANVIATAEATAVAAAMATARDGCVGGSAVAVTAAGTTTAREDGQQQHSTPPFRPRLVVKCSLSAGSHSFPTKPSAHSVAQDVSNDFIELEHMWAGHSQR
jgi:hypothetical protein